MAKLSYAVILWLLIGTALFQTTLSLSSEDLIHELIRDAKAKCSGSCQDAAQTVLDRSNINDVCDAVNNYALCALVACNGGDSVKTYFVQAQEICDGASVMQVSILAVLMAAVARFLF